MFFSITEFVFVYFKLNFLKRRMFYITILKFKCFLSKYFFDKFLIEIIIITIIAKEIQLERDPIHDLLVLNISIKIAYGGCAFGVTAH